MDTAITSFKNLVLLKISNGICIYREESFVIPVQTKSSLKRPLFVISIVGMIVSAMVISFLPFSLTGDGYNHNSNAEAASPAESQTASADLPIRIKIPIINVDAPLESVGLTSAGEVAVPKGPTNAAWYNLGPRPGENGAAVIDGHFGWWKNGTQAVFNNLGKLHKGDKLFVEDGSGVTTTFVVREIRKYDQNANSSDVFGSNDGKAHLNLITCDGAWNNTQQSYPNRLVVFTDKEMAE
jgi:LPXTG-site transpeptidase (sortase) family protein